MKKISTQIVSDWFAKKNACVISGGSVGGSPFLFKNRDRMYVPTLQIVHTKKKGVEVLYFEDLDTGWVEGINEFGIAAVNSALRVGFDEKEKEIVKTTGQKSKDRKKFLEALCQKTIEEALEVLCTFMGGASGHTLLSDGKSFYTVESTSKHECVTRKLPIGKLYVRTNHGFAYDDAGYTKGEDFLSSIKRRNKAIRVLKKSKNLQEVALNMMKGRSKDLKDPFSVVRDTKKMMTTSQILFDLKNKKMLLYAIPNRVNLKKFQKSRIKNPKLQCEIFTYENISDNEKISVSPFKKWM